MICGECLLPHGTAALEPSRRRQTPPLLRGHSILHWGRGRTQRPFVLPSHPGPFKSCTSSSTMRFPPAQRASSQDSGTSQQRHGVTGKLWTLPCDQFGCDQPCPVVCGPCWLLTRTQGSGLSSQGREEQSVRHCQALPRLPGQQLATIPAAHRSQGHRCGTDSHLC